VPPQDHKPDEFGNLPGRDQSSRETGEFTRAFGGKADQTKHGDPSGDGGATPGSLTQLLGGKSKKPSPPPTDKLDQPQSEAPNPHEPRPASSFTSAFDGVNAFTRDPADLGEYNFQPEAGKRSRPDLNPSASPASFTRLFGSGEGALTPAGEEGVEEDRPRPRMANDRKPSHGGLPGFPQPASVPDRHDLPRPPEVEPGSFTEAFRSQSAPELPESKVQRGSFTEEFGSSPSWTGPEPLPPSMTERPYPSGPGGLPPPRNVEPVLPSNPHRPPTPAGGFEQLINPSIDPLRPEPALPTNATLPSMRSPRLPDRPLPDPNYSPRGRSSGDGATVIFNPSHQPEPEVVEPRGKSEYTMVVERSKLRPPVEVPGGPGLPYGAGAAAAPPSPPQHPQLAPPLPPAWAPTPTPAPRWQAPQLTPPPMPQAPALAPPALPLTPPTLGDKLVSYLPFMLALTVINFLGMLAVLIILFATRK
jgi:hypothetical protein